MPAVERQQIDPLDGGAALTAIGVNRANHHSLSACFAENFGDAVLIAHECAAHWFALDAAATEGGRHRCGGRNAMTSLCPSTPGSLPVRASLVRLCRGTMPESNRVNQLRLIIPLISVAMPVDDMVEAMRGGVRFRLFKS
jgi:hypothetical protein